MDQLPPPLKFLIWGYCLPVKKFNQVILELKEEAALQKYDYDNLAQLVLRKGHLLPCLIGLPSAPRLRRTAAAYYPRDILPAYDPLDSLAYRYARVHRRILHTSHEGLFL